MKKDLDNYLYNFSLIILIWLLMLIIYFFIQEPQIVFLYHSYSEPFYLLPRNSLFILPIAFSFVILYNLFLGIFGVEKSFINKLNTIIFLLSLITYIYVFLINY